MIQALKLQDSARSTRLGLTISLPKGEGICQAITPPDIMIKAWRGARIVYLPCNVPDPHCAASHDQALLHQLPEATTSCLLSLLPFHNQTYGVGSFNRGLDVPPTYCPFSFPSYIPFTIHPLTY